MTDRAELALPAGGPRLLRPPVSQRGPLPAPARATLGRARYIRGWAWAVPPTREVGMSLYGGWVGGGIQQLRGGCVDAAAGAATFSTRSS